MYSATLEVMGKGGYRRSSLAKRIRNILNLGTEAPDSMGIGRFAVHSEGLPALLGYQPEDPKVSPILSYHHQYEFNVADDVDTVDTWEETSSGAGTPLHLVPSPRPVGEFEPAAEAGGFYQYQERNFSAFAVEGFEQDIWFLVNLAHDVEDSYIYIGLTPTSVNSIQQREYGYGFEYDPVTGKWSFVVDNVIDGEPFHESAELFGEGGQDTTLSFRLEWKELAFGGPVEARILLKCNALTGIGWEHKEDYFVLLSDLEIRDVPLRLTFGVENRGDTPMSLRLRVLKELIPKHSSVITI